ELQKQIAKQAGDQKLPDAAKAADMAAKALDQGDLPAAIENQEKALDQLNKDAMGQPMEGMQPGELAKTQKQVLDATKALQQSQQATNAAQAALQQAQANAPMAIQGQLNQANNALQQAANQLQQGQPGQAGMNQQQAAQQIQQALDALNAAQQQAMGMGMEMGMGMGEKGMGMGMGEKGMGEKGMGMGEKGMGMGQANQGMNPGMSEGDMNGAEKLKNVGSSGVQATGDGTFINLRKKEREKVQQAADAQFPAEFRELIKQYNVNIKNAKPMTPGGK
ncbi:MAG TPA: hypothetical protein VG122_21040, partial [Gemmata sp.]|nr:hypothetical protein [Gemmata sp.]